MTDLDDVEKTKSVPMHGGAVQILLYLIGTIWLIFSAVTIIKGGWIIGVLMIGNGVVLIGIGAGLNRFRKLFYWVGVIVVGVNILLTFTDQFGFFDFATLLIILAIFILLVANRKYYLN